MMEFMLIPQVFSLKKKNILNIIVEVLLKCDVFDGNVENGLKQPTSYTFALNEPPGYEIFCERETAPYKKNKTVLDTITFYLGHENHKEVHFKGETLTFTLHIAKI